MSGYFKTSEDNLIKTYTLAFRYLVIIALPVAVGTTLVADKIILLVYGAPFADSSIVLQILIWAVMFGMIQPVFSNVLVAIDRQKLILLSTAFCAAVNIVLNFILIPAMSYNGAAVATVTTTIIFLASIFYFVSKHLQMVPVHKILVKPVIGVLVMGGSIYYLADISLFILIPLAAGVYLVTLLVLGTFSDEDWDMVRKVRSRN